jgi:exoribonuclease R
MSALDVVASTIGQTLYKDGQAIRPMLPHALSEDAFSLLPGKERLGISLSFKWKDSVKSDFEWFESKLVNQKTFTYDEAQISEIPEIKILASVFCVEDSHDWIAEAMKLYNLEAAKLLVSSGVGILRTHRAPDLERLAKYTSWDSSLASLANSSAQYIDYQPGVNTTHFGLDTNAYCHITSPIRRYADLMNQRLLKQIIRGNKESLYVTCSIHELNVRAKASKAFERDLCYMRALNSNSNHCVGRILDIIKKEEHVKLRILVSEWKRVINVTYKGSQVEDAWLIKSKDEKTERLVKEGDLIGIDFAANLTARRWKERLVISLT